MNKNITIKYLSNNIDIDYEIYTKVNKRPLVIFKHLNEDKGYSNEFKKYN